VDTAVPLSLVSVVQNILEQYPESFVWSESETADLSLSVNEGEPLAEWVYAAVVPFPTVQDEISSADLQAMWRGGQLYVDEAMAAFLREEWGEVVEPLVAADGPAAMWADRPSFGLLAFDELTPDLKVLAVDGLSPLTADFVADDYPLKMTIGVMGEETAVSRFLDVWPTMMSNREPT
jgi:hypothetical protein